MAARAPTAGTPAKAARGMMSFHAALLGLLSSIFSSTICRIVSLAEPKATSKNGAKRGFFCTKVTASLAMPLSRVAPGVSGNSLPRISLTAVTAAAGRAAAKYPSTPVSGRDMPAPSPIARMYRSGALTGTRSVAPPIFSGRVLLKRRVN